MADIIDHKATRGCVGSAGFMTIALSVTAMVIVLLAWPGTVATLATMVCMLFSLAFGGVLTLWGVRGLLSKDHSGAEEEILRVAQRNGGTVQVSTVAAQSDLGLREARDVLDELAREGIARLDIDDEGRECYSFPGLEEVEFEQDDHREQKKLSFDEKVVFDQSNFDFDRSMRKAVKVAKKVVDIID